MLDIYLVLIVITSVILFRVALPYATGEKHNKHRERMNSILRGGYNE